VNKKIIAGVVASCFVILGVLSAISLTMALTAQTQLKQTNNEISSLKHKISISNNGTLSAMRHQISMLHGEIIGLGQSVSSTQTTVASAQHARLGICWSEVSGTIGPNGTYYPGSVSIIPLTLQSGVYSCGNGSTYVSVVPSKGSNL
jgi:hypothetical protein